MSGNSRWMSAVLAPSRARLLVASPQARARSVGSRSRGGSCDRSKNLKGQSEGQWEGEDRGILSGDQGQVLVSQAKRLDFF